MTQGPEQEALFEALALDREAVAAEIAAAALAAEALRPRTDTPDATDQYLEEIGGGGRRETRAVDPPRVPRPLRAAQSRPGGPSRAYDDERYPGTPGTPSPHRPVGEVLDALTPEQAAINRRGADLAREALRRAQSDRASSDG